MIIYFCILVGFLAGWTAQIMLSATQFKRALIRERNNFRKQETKLAIRCEERVKEAYEIGFYDKNEGTTGRRRSVRK